MEQKLPCNIIIIIIIIIIIFGPGPMTYSTNY